MRKGFLLAGLMMAGAASAADHSDLAKRFGARETVYQMAISPDGTKVVAVIAGPGRSRRAGVFPVDDIAKWKPILEDEPDRAISGCDWATDSRLVCSFYAVVGRRGDALGLQRLIAINPDGGQLKLLSAPEVSGAIDVVQTAGSVIDWLGDDTGAHIMMTRQFPRTLESSSEGGLGVERVDPVGMSRQTIETPRADAREYITDGHGTIRIMGTRPRVPGGYDDSHTDYLYRAVGSRGWVPLSRVNSDGVVETGFNPYAVDRDLNVAYGFDQQDGREALFKIALDGSMKRDLVFADPHVDVTGLVRIGRQQRVVGVSYVTDKRTTEFFDPELKRLRASLTKALPDQPLVSFIGADGDEGKLLLWAGSDVDPGHYMVFTKATHELHNLADARPELANVQLAPVKSISFPAADGTMIPAYLTLPVEGAGKNLPAIVMPHGGPSARDEWGFDWLAQFFAARGYVVLQPNYRGSTGYGDIWLQQNGFKSWKTAIGDVNDAGRWLAKQGIADPAKLAIVGWSYGGYAALQSAVLDPDLYKAIIAIAPVTDLDALRKEHEGYVDYKQVAAAIGSGPQTREGSPAQNAARITAPVLIFHGDADQNVLVDESRLMNARLKAAGKRVDYVEFKGLRHQLDDGDARAELLDRSDAFLRTSLGISTK